MSRSGKRCEFIEKALKNQGYSAGKHCRIDKKQLRMGIKIEMEHTDCPSVAKKIATDHLCELPDYYTRLKKVEK